MTSQENSSAIRPLAQDHVNVFTSPDPQSIHAYSPGILRLENGRLIATLDIGGSGVEALDGPKFKRGQMGWDGQGKVYSSDDGGESWQHRCDFPFIHARPFVADKRLYVLGHAGDLMIMATDDQGETWSEAKALSEHQHWHQAPCNVHYANDCVYLVMERRVSHEITSWYVGELAPVLMRGRLDTDLCQQENWTFASELSFQDVLPKVEAEATIDFFGVPFFNCPFPQGDNPAGGRHCAPMGWLETNVIQFTDPNHCWHDTNGKTFHLWSRAHTGGTGYACIAKVVEKGERPGTGEMMTQLESVPSGKTIFYTPCPGGQMKFHVLYDDSTKLYWLLSTQATDSMTEVGRMPEDRYNLPNNQRRRLQLHFSKNMIDWCFAGLVASGNGEKESRHYASMAIDGEDLVVLSRSGDSSAKSSHDGNLITFHRINAFRSLVY